MLVQHVDHVQECSQNSMNCLMEVLGLALPYNGTLAVSDQRREMIRQAFQLVENIKMILNLVILLQKKQLMMHLL